MKLKNIVLNVLLLGCTSQFMIAEEQPMTKKEIALKTAKIFGYLAEFFCSAVAFHTLHSSDWEDINVASFKEIKTTWRKTKKKSNDYEWLVGSGIFQVPFLASMGHAVHGVYKELTPVVKAIYRNGYHRGAAISLQEKPSIVKNTSEEIATAA